MSTALLGTLCTACVTAALLLYGQFTKHDPTISSIGSFADNPHDAVKPPYYFEPESTCTTTALGEEVATYQVENVTYNVSISDALYTYAPRWRRASSRIQTS